jgi:hypothetical protein
VYPVTTSIVPGLTQVTQNVQVAERGEFRYPWQNLVDLRLTKIFRSNGLRFEPTVDLYNIFNNNAVTNAVTTIGPSLAALGHCDGTAAASRWASDILKFGIRNLEFGMRAWIPPPCRIQRPDVRIPNSKFQIPNCFISLSPDVRNRLRARDPMA